MRLSDYFQTIAESDPNDWVISEGHYQTRFSQISGGGHPVPWLEIDAPHSVYTYANDLSISVAMGRDHLDSFQEDWAQHSDGSYPPSSWYDFLYNGSAIYSSLYVHYDGSRGSIPPKGPITGEIPRIQNDVYRLLHIISGAGAYDYDGYIKQIGATIVEEEWPYRRG